MQGNKPSLNICIQSNVIDKEPEKNTTALCNKKWISFTQYTDQ